MVYFKILKYLFAGIMIGALVYLIVSNITVTVEFDEPVWPPCPNTEEWRASCPS